MHKRTWPALLLLVTALSCLSQNTEELLVAKKLQVESIKPTRDVDYIGPGNNTEKASDFYSGPWNEHNCSRLIIIE